MEYNNFKSIYETDALIIFDTNVLLRLYEYSPETGNLIIDMLMEDEDNIYLPSHVIFEFEKHHSRTRGSQRKKYIQLSKKIDQATTSVKSKIIKQLEILEDFKFPNIDELRTQCEVKLDEIDNAFEEYVDEHKVLEEINDKYLREDKVGKLVVNCKKSDRTSRKLSKSDYYKIYTEGEMRFKYDISPGCKDASKKSIDKYGDLVIWKQVIELSQTTEKNIVFITDDVKRDWWEKNEKNEPIALHKSLIEEFEEDTTSEIIGLTANTFYDYLGRVKNIEFPSKVQQILKMNIEEYIDALIQTYDFEIALLDSISENIQEVEITNEINEGDLIYDIDKIELIELKNYTTDFNNESNTYILTLNIKLTAIKMELKVDFDDTPYLEPDGKSSLDGEITILLDRSVSDDITMFDLDEIDYEDIKVVSGILDVYDSTPQSEMCMECGKNIGDYIHWDGEMICDSCAMSSSNESCPDCGRIIPSENMGGNGFCSDCAHNH